MRNKLTLCIFCLIVGMLSSCKTQYLDVTGIAYQSLRPTKEVNNKTEIPKDAKIIVKYIIGTSGVLNVVVQNNTDKIMTIDRTKSFFRGASGNSIPYYDPVVRTSTQSTTSGNTSGGSVNLGSVASAVGIGGVLGTALNGVNVGGSNTTATTNTNTTYFVDQPQISIAPYGSASMGRSFDISGVGTDFLKAANATSTSDVNNIFTPQQTYATCNICISYSIDDGNKYETIITDIYANTLLVNKVWNKGMVNEALRNLYQNKKDALTENWYILYFASNKPAYKAKTTEIINYK